MTRGQRALRDTHGTVVIYLSMTHAHIDLCNLTNKIIKIMLDKKNTMVYNKGTNKGEHPIGRN